MKPGMITVTVTYPNNEESSFDKDYYQATHLPLVSESLGNSLKGLMAEYGIAGGAPGSKPPYHCIATMYFQTVEDFQNSFGPHANTIMGDIPKFTNSEPVIQISEIGVMQAS